MTEKELVIDVQKRLKALEEQVEAIRDQQKVSRANLLLLVVVVLDHIATWV